MCRQLGIGSYHKKVTPGDSSDKEKTTSDVFVLTVRVQLVEMVKLRPQEGIVAGVRLVGDGAGGQGQWSRSEVMLFESDEQLGMETGATIVSALVRPSHDGVAQVLISNAYSLTHRIPEAMEIGKAVPVEIVEPPVPDEEQPQVYSATREASGDQSDEHRRKLLMTQFQNQLSCPRTGSSK